jgi:hypothetical protein
VEWSSVPLVRSGRRTGRPRASSSAKAAARSPRGSGAGRCRGRRRGIAFGRDDSGRPTVCRRGFCVLWLVIGWALLGCVGFHREAGLGAVARRSPRRAAGRAAHTGWRCQPCQRARFEDVGAGARAGQLDAVDARGDAGLALRVVAGGDAGTW